MKHVVSYSGGLNSFMVGKIVVDQFGPDDTFLVFTDTKTEDEDLYRFINQTVAHLGAEYISLADGRNVWQVFNDVKYMGNSRCDPCSKHLKKELFKNWLVGNFGPNECTLYVGMGWDECHRLVPMQERYSPYLVKAPLTEYPYFSKTDIIQYLDSINIEIPKLHKKGFSHNNCGGFCVKAGLAQFKKLYEEMPERYRYHESEQEKLFCKIGQHGFLRKTTGGIVRYLSLKQFRQEFLENLENKKEIDEYDIGGCGCFT